VETKLASTGAPKRVCILVLGMHRSGTSALTRMINLLGAALPENLLSPHASNPSGLWEPSRLVDIDDEVLLELGSHWDDWRALDARRLPADRVAHYREKISRVLLDEYGDTPLFVLKDPRICRLTWLYFPVFDAMSVDVASVVMTRHPASVAKSLLVRNQFSTGFSSLLWIRYVLDAEYATRGRRRTFLSYEGLMEDWRSSAKALFADLDVTLPLNGLEERHEVDGFLSEDLRHHTGDGLPLEKGATIGLLREVYEAIHTLSQNRENMTAQAALDSARAALDRIGQISGEAFFTELAKRIDLQNEMHSDELGTLRADLEARTLSVASLQGDLEAFATLTTSLQIELEARSASIISLQCELESQAASIASLQSKIAEREFADSHRLLMWKRRLIGLLSRQNA